MAESDGWSVDSNGLVDCGVLIAFAIFIFLIVEIKNNNWGEYTPIPITNVNWFFTITYQTKHI